MKQYLLKPCILFVCISLILLLPKRSFGQLNGNYTINPTKAASSSNYKNWASAVGDLISGTRTDGGTVKGPGISGAVVFTVYDTVYANTNVAITQISGTSYSKTITFKSTKGDSSKCVIQYPSSTSSTDDYAVLLDGADYITFKQIGMERTGTNTYSTVVQITNDADNNKFLNCQMKAVKMASSTTLGFAYGVGSCIYFVGNGDSTEITKNRMLYGYNGIYNLIACTAVKITGNLIDTSGSSGIYMASQTSLKISGNTFNMGDFGSSSGHYTNYGMRIETSPSLIISKNNIRMLAVNAQVSRAIVIITTVSTASAPALVYNNMIMSNAGNTNCNGMAMYGCNYLNFYYNNVLITNSVVADASAYFHNPAYVSTNINIKNNNLINKGGSYAYSVSGTNTTDLDSVTNNNLYTSGNYLGIWNSSNYGTLTAWQGATGKDANSINIDPGYTSANNLHVTNYGLKTKGVPYAGIKDDFDGDPRDVNTPDIGADELKPVGDDAGMVALTKPLANVCVGVLPVTAVIKNYGTNKLLKATITWSVNGISQTPYNYTGSLLINKLDTVTIGTFNFTNVPNPKFVLKSTLPNGQTDGAQYNDSVIVVRALRPPPAANAGADLGLCLGDSALIGPTNNPTLTYKWFTLSNSLIASTSQMYVKPTTQTSYVLEVKSVAFGCTARDTIVVSVNSKPVADAGPDYSICLGSTVQLGKAPQNGFTYSWTSSPAGFTSAVANPSVSPTTTTTYTLVKTITATGCKASDAAVVTVNQLPTPKISGLKFACDGDAMNFTTPATTGSSYKWTVKGGIILGGQNTNSLSLRWNVADTGKIKVIETNTATCKDSSAYSVLVSANPVANFSVKDVCKGTATSFTDLSTDAQTHAWTFGDGGTSTLVSPTHLYATVGTFNIRLIVTNSANCVDTANKQTITNPIPVANFGMTKTAEKTFDFLDSSSIPSGTINQWYWEFGDGDTAIIKSPNHVYAAAGNMVIKLCVTSAAGCQNCTTKNLNVLGVFNPTISNKISAVPNPGYGIFNITSGQSVKSVVVTNISGQIVGTYQPFSNNFSIDLSGQPEGIYFVRVISDNGSGVLKLVKQ